MISKRFYLLPAVFAVLTLGFQNCDRAPSNLKFSEHSGSKISNESDNGQHYDGKIFVLLGDVCADGTQVQSKIRLDISDNAELLRQDCQDIAPLALARTEIQFNASNADELIYKNKSYILTTGFIAPKLTNPVSPLAFGAKCDGMTDDTAAFQAAINASDVLVPAGTCVIKNTLFIQSSNKHFACEPGAILYHPDPYAGKMIHITPAPGNSISDISIVNCYFKGSNSVAPQYYTDGRQEDAAIRANTRVNNLMIAGNTFDRFFGEAAFQAYAPTAADTGRGYQVVHNTFKSCGRFGALFNGTIDGTIAYNTAIDCNMGVSNESTSQASGNNIIEYNKISAVFGVGFANNFSSAVFLTGGINTNSNFSTNIVRYNSVSGGSSRILQNVNSGTLPAQYIGNTCTEGCTVVNN